MKSQIRLVACCAGILLCLVGVESTFASCGYTSGEEACEIILGGACPSTGKWCGDKDCLGRNFGEEAMFIGAGKYPKIWIAESDGTFMELSARPCEISTNDGVSIIRMGDWDHCGVILATDEHLYFELFASIPETECVAWVECKCY